MEKLKGKYGQVESLRVRESQKNMTDFRKSKSSTIKGRKEQVRTSLLFKSPAPN